MNFDYNGCDYRGTSQHSLTTDIESIHEGVENDCNQSDYRPTMKDELTVQILSI